MLNNIITLEQQEQLLKLIKESESIVCVCQMWHSPHSHNSTLYSPTSNMATVSSCSAMVHPTTVRKCKKMTAKSAKSSKMPDLWC